MTDHTGPNTRPGGCHGGLLSRRYQRLLSTGVVAAAPIPAVPATAPRISAASRRVRPDGRDSAADTVPMFLTLPPPLSDPEPTQPTCRRISQPRGRGRLAPAPAVALSLRSGRLESRPGPDVSRRQRDTTCEGAVLHVGGGDRAVAVPYFGAAGAPGRVDRRVYRCDQPAVGTGAGVFGRWSAHVAGQRDHTVAAGHDPEHEGRR